MVKWKKSLKEFFFCRQLFSFRTYLTKNRTKWPTIFEIYWGDNCLHFFVQMSSIFSFEKNSSFHSSLQLPITTSVPMFLFILLIFFFGAGGSVRAYTLLPQFLDPQNLKFRRVSYKSPLHSVLFTFYCFVLFSSLFLPDFVLAFLIIYLFH